MPKTKPKTSPKTKSKATAKTATKIKSRKKSDKPAKSVKKAKSPIVAPTAATVKVKPRKVQAPTHNQIAIKAYEIWLTHGRPVGQDAENWQAAKRALLNEA